MPDGRQSDWQDAAAGMSRAALQALVRQGDDDHERRPPLESFLSRLVTASCAADRSALSEVLRDMRKARICPARIAEDYIPVVARRLGQAWVKDRISFAQTSIGAARLQGALWELSAHREPSVEAMMCDRPAYLVGVPQGFQHTLGATVLAGVLRHRGFSVQLRVNLTPEVLCQDIKRCTFRGVLLSVHDHQRLESLRALTLEAANCDRNMPVIIGGHILGHADHIKCQTMADLITSDVDQAVAFCDQRYAATQAHRIGVPAE